jgi:DNA-binding CsgD family transcriptional regulator
LRSSLERITDPTGGELERKLVQLTPREIVICRMILNGSINKEIAEGLSVSEHTIQKFRQNIRRKLKLTGKKINLQSYLQSLVTNLDDAQSS